MRKMPKIFFGALSAVTLAVAGAAIAAPGDAGAEKGWKRGGPEKGPTTRAEAEAHADRMFARLDVNGDGVIDARDREARVAEHFAKLDTNGDGVLSLEEFKARPERPERGPDDAPHAAHGDGKDRAQAPDGDHKAPFGPRHGEHRGGPDFGLTGADTDNDGRITAAEFKAAALARFDRADTNKDGTLTAEERKAQRQEGRESRKEGRKQAANPAAPAD